VAWWVSITPEVVRGIESFGFKDPPPDSILESVERNLANYVETSAVDRWAKCPDDFFVYCHVSLKVAACRLWNSSLTTHRLPWAY
jgi:hypothetical protein